MASWEVLHGQMQVGWSCLECKMAVSEHLSSSCQQGVYPRNVALVCHIKVFVSFSPLKTVQQVITSYPGQCLQPSTLV